MYILRLALQGFNPCVPPPGPCVRCGSEALVRWGQRHRRVKDRQCAAATVQRYWCKACHRTFSVHPQGLERSPQTTPYQATLLTLYLLGLSLRKVVLALSLFAFPTVSFVTVWRDLQRWGQHFQRPHLQAQIVGVDTTFVPVRGVSQGIFIAVTLGDKPLLVQAVGSAEDYQRAFATLHSLGVTVVVSDDDHAFYGPVEALGLRQQGCLWHAQRVISRALRKLSLPQREQWQSLITLLWESLKAPPPHPPPALVQAQGLPLPAPLRYAVVYALDLWHRLTLYQRIPELPRTNNLSERAIGRTKFRARTVRGFKSLPGALNFCSATQYLLAPS